MDMTTLFATALGLQTPWQVKDLQFSPEGHRLGILIGFTRGADFSCPACGQPCKTHDTEERIWRHMDFFQHAACLTFERFHVMKLLGKAVDPVRRKEAKDASGVEEDPLHPAQEPFKPHGQPGTPRPNGSRVPRCQSCV